MKTLLERQRPFDSTEQIVSAEFIKLIRKLRWIGMEDEAKRIQTQLALCAAFHLQKACSRHRTTQTRCGSLNRLSSD
jgi:hypothetical protein